MRLGDFFGPVLEDLDQGAPRPVLFFKPTRINNLVESGIFFLVGVVYTYLKSKNIGRFEVTESLSILFLDGDWKH